MLDAFLFVCLLVCSGSLLIVGVRSRKNYSQNVSPRALNTRRALAHHHTDIRIELIISMVLL